MTSEDRRRSDDKNWQEIKDFIVISTRHMTEASLYRIMDKEIQANILAEAKKTNGRVSDLEDWKKEIETKIQDRKDSKVNSQTLINIVLAVIVAVSAVVMAIPVIGNWLKHL